MEFSQSAELSFNPLPSVAPDFPQGCEPVVEEREHRQMLFLMAEYFRTVGCSDMKARLPGFMPPPVLNGTLQDHRPDFTCRQANQAQTPLLLEVVTLNDLDDAESDNRWSLLASAARLYNAELHFVIPKWTEQGAIEPVLRRRLAAMELTPHHVWTV